MADLFAHVTCARAIGAPVVGAARSVVVAELDNNEIALLDEVGDIGKASFLCIAAGGAAGNGEIDYRNVEAVVEILTPAVKYQRLLTGRKN